MRKIRLDKNRYFEFKVHHLRKYLGNHCDATSVSLFVIGPQGEWQNCWVEYARCHPKDHFCKKTGRLLATQKLLKLVKPFFVAEVRKVIFEGICPDFPPKKKRSRRDVQPVVSAGEQEAGR